jgi:hypothetical protein
MGLESLSTSFVDFVNYIFIAFVVMLFTAGMFFSYPFLRSEEKDEAKLDKEAKVFTIGFAISIAMALIPLLIMLVIPFLAMFYGINVAEFVSTMFSIIGYTNNNRSDNELLIIIGLIFASFLVIAWVSGFIVRSFGHKIFYK